MLFKTSSFMGLKSAYLFQVATTQLLRVVTATQTLIKLLNLLNTTCDNRKLANSDILSLFANHITGFKRCAIPVIK